MRCILRFQWRIRKEWVHFLIWYIGRICSIQYLESDRRRETRWWLWSHLADLPSKSQCFRFFYCSITMQKKQIYRRLTKWSIQEERGMRTKRLWVFHLAVCRSFYVVCNDTRCFFRYSEPQSRSRTPAIVPDTQDSTASSVSETISFTVIGWA